MIRTISSLALILHLVSQSALAVTLDPVDSGIFAFRQEGGGLGGGITVTHSSLATQLNFNYQFIEAGNGERFQRGYAIYDLSGVSGAVVGASLEMELIETTLAPGFPPPFPPPAVSVRFSLNQVDSDPALFDSSYSESNSIFCFPNCTGLGDGFGIFIDLGDGPGLGSLAYGDTTGTQSTGLGGPALELLNQAAGDLFVIGIAGGPAGGLNNYNGSLRLGSPQLTLQLDPVPLPAGFFLFATALAGLFAFRARIRG